MTYLTAWATQSLCQSQFQYSCLWSGVLLFGERRNEVCLGIAGALSYLCESRLPGDLRHMKVLNDEERRKAIEAMDSDYVLVLTPGMNGGGLRWTIDSTI